LKTRTGSICTLRQQLDESIDRPATLYQHAITVCAQLHCNIRKEIGVKLDN